MNYDQSDGNSKAPLVGKVAVFMGLFYSIGLVAFFGFFPSHINLRIAWTCFTLCKFSNLSQYKPILPNTKEQKDLLHMK